MNEHHAPAGENGGVGIGIAEIAQGDAGDGGVEIELGRDRQPLVGTGEADHGERLPRTLESDQ